MIPDLASIRTSRGLSLEQIAQSTKIGVFYLQAIENGEIRKLPGTFYTESYIRQYARAIEYDEHDLLENCGISRGHDEELAPAPQPATPAGWLVRLMTNLFHVLDSRRTG